MSEQDRGFQECCDGLLAEVNQAHRAVITAREANTYEQGDIACWQVFKAMWRAEDWADALVSIAPETRERCDQALAEAYRAYDDVVRELKARGLWESEPAEPPEPEEVTEARAKELAAEMKDAMAGGAQIGDIAVAWHLCLKYGTMLRTPRAQGETIEDLLARSQQVKAWREGLEPKLREALCARALTRADWLLDGLADLVDLVSEEDKYEAENSALSWLLDRDEVESAMWALNDEAVRARLRDLDREAGFHTTTFSLIDVPSLPPDVNQRFAADRDGLSPSWWSQFAE
jgi:hypothetical protein